MAISGKKDANRVTTMLGVLNTDGVTVTQIAVNPANNAIKVVDGTTGSSFTTPNAQRDDNRVPTLWGVSSSDFTTPVSIYVDSNNNLLIDSN